MGLLDKLRGKRHENDVPPIKMTLSWEEPTQNPLPKGAPLVGTTEPVCPYCGVVLAKKPGRKTKCKACGNDIYVRTRPQDRLQVSVTEAETEIIAEQWSIVNGNHEEYLERKKLYENTRLKLATQWGKEPSEDDVEWAVLNIKSIQHAREGNWGLYRNVRHSQAEQLRRQKRFDLALEFYLEVCYLDLNGPNNNAGQTAGGRVIPAWDPKSAWLLAPGVVDEVAGMAARLGLSNDDLKVRFLKAADRASTLALPVSPNSAWKKLADALAK